MSSTTVMDRPETANPSFDPTFRIQLGAHEVAVVGPDDDGIVVLRLGDDGERVFAPSQALALAAALQAVAVHLLEEPRVITRSTEPGEPEQHGIGGGL